MSLDAIGIVCRDLNKTKLFYELLNLKFSPVGGSDHWEAVLPSGMRLMLDTEELVKKLNSDWQRPTGSGLVLCFKQDNADAVNQLFDKLCDLEAKVYKKPWDAFWGQRYASILDPNGNQIDIFADLDKN